MSSCVIIEIIKKISNTTHLIQKQFDCKLMIPGNLEHFQESKNLVDVNLAVSVFVIVRVVVVDHGEQFAEEVQGFSLGQPLVFVSVQLRWI